jgi:hypothetical protein
MIISINATVCSAEDHGADGSFEIAGSDDEREGEEGPERGNDLQGKNFKNRCMKCRSLQA